MQVHITQKDIDEGSQGSATDCAIARALRREGIRASVAVVPSPYGYGMVSMAVDQMGRKFELGEAGKMFIEQFDHDKKSVAPVTLTLSPFFPNSHSLRREMAYSVKLKPMPQMFIDEGKVPDSITTEYMKIDPKLFATSNFYFKGYDMGTF